METKDLWNRLAAFGLDENEARLYFHLSQVGAQRASELSEITGIHRTEVYRVAKGLVDKGFAERTLERPVRFAPKPLEEVLAVHMERAAKQVEELQNTSAGLLQDWPRGAQEWESVSTRFVVHQGPPQVRSLLERMLRQAEELTVVASPATLRRLGLPALLRAMEAAERPVVRVLTTVSPEGLPAIDALEEHCQVRHVDAPARMECVVLDEREAAVFVAGSQPPRQEETVLWLNAQDFVAGQRALVDRLWAQGIDVQDVRTALELRRRPRHAEVLRGTWVFLSRLKALLHESDAAIVHCTGEEFEAWTGRGLWQVVEARRRAGADIRLLVSDPKAPLPTGVVATDEAWPVTVAATPQGDVLAARPSADVWGIQAALPEVGMWAWHLLQAKWDEAVLVSH